MTADRLVLWRHGQTDWNVTGRFQGQADVPLNATGEAQAAAAAAVLANMEPTVLWASDLERTRQTSAALTALTGLAHAARQAAAGGSRRLLGGPARLRDPGVGTRGVRRPAPG